MWKAFIWQKKSFAKFLRIVKKRKITFETVGDQKKEKEGWGKRGNWREKSFWDL